MDLNDDCLLLILEHLDFISLLSIAEINMRYKSLASEIAKPILRKKFVHIGILMEPHLQSPGIYDKEHFIQIKNHTYAEQVLKSFGHLIQKLKLHNIYKDAYDANRSIHKLINLHCAKSLIEITLYSSTKSLLDEFTNTFANVQRIFIENTVYSERDLNEIFPAVRHLDFVIFKLPQQPLSVNVTFKYLESLNLCLSPHGGFLSQIWAAELITKNPHIQRLKLEHASGRLIYIAADTIPKLEKLELVSVAYLYNQVPFNFRNVKELVVKDNFLESLFLNLKFENIEELNTNNLAESMFGETGFLITNKNLKKLRLVSDATVTIYLNSDLFRQFARSNTTLQEIFISHAYNFELDTFLQFIDNNKQLQRLEIEFLRSVGRRAVPETLRDRVSDIWSIDEFSKNLILTKKNTSY